MLGVIVLGFHGCGGKRTPLHGTGTRSFSSSNQFWMLCPVDKGAGKSDYFRNGRARFPPYT